MRSLMPPFLAEARARRFGAISADAGVVAAYRSAVVEVRFEGLRSMTKPRPTPPATEPTLAPKSAAAWRAWLKTNHATSSGVWLRLGKTERTGAALTYAQALE